MEQTFVNDKIFTAFKVVGGKVTWIGDAGEVESLTGEQYRRAYPIRGFYERALVEQTWIQGEKVYERPEHGS